MNEFLNDFKFLAWEPGRAYLKGPAEQGLPGGCCEWGGFAQPRQCNLVSQVPDEDLEAG